MPITMVKDVLLAHVPILWYEVGGDELIATIDTKGQWVKLHGVIETA